MSTVKTSAKPKVKKLPLRSAVKPADTWDLASLYPSDAAWEKAFAAWEKQIAGYEKFKGHLGDDAKTLAACLKFDADFDRTGERLGVYAHLKVTEDQANSEYQRMMGRYRNIASLAGQAASYIRPELMAVKAATMQKFLVSKELADYRLMLDRILRYRAHTLGKKEENLLAMQAEMSDASNQIFRQLNDSDLKWGPLKNEKGEYVELSTATFSLFLHSPKRSDTKFKQNVERLLIAEENSQKSCR